MISIEVLQQLEQSWESHVLPVQLKRRAFRRWQLNHLPSHVLHSILKTPVVENPVLIHVGCMLQKELQGRTFVTLHDSHLPALHLLKFRRERKI